MGSPAIVEILAYLFAVLSGSVRLGLGLAFGHHSRILQTVRARQRTVHLPRFPWGATPRHNTDLQTLQVVSSALPNRPSMS